MCGRNPKLGVWIHFENVECHILLLGHTDFGHCLRKSRKTQITRNVSETFVFGCMKVRLNVTFQKRYINLSPRYWFLPRNIHKEFLLKIFNPNKNVDNYQ